MKTLIFFLATVFTFNCYGQVLHTNNTLSEINRIQRNKQFYNGSCPHETFYVHPAAHIKKTKFAQHKIISLELGYHYYLQHFKCSI